MSNIRILPQQKERIETEIIQFGDDWPGLFIRGDNCAYFAMALQFLVDEFNKIELNECVDIVSLSACKGLLDDLYSSIK